jgi:predicted Zn-dependent protease
MSITRDQLIQFIEKPGLLKEQTIGELKEIVDEFPYFQSAQLLYTYNLFTQDNFRYTGYLKTCSIYATDRQVLYQLFHPQYHPDVNLKQTAPEGMDDQESFAIFELAEEKQITETEFSRLYSNQPSESEANGFDLLSFDLPDTSYPLDTIETKPGSADIQTQNEPGTSNPEGKVDLIEQFIKINPSIQPRVESMPLQNAPFESREVPENENDEFITETLSRIYLKQGHYQKAIESFKRLSLKFPEKSVYFAHQIVEIKKLIN